jgi:hypothetical protein
MLAFRVTPKVFAPCLGVLHVMWGAWCMDDPWCSMMDMHMWRWLALRKLELVWIVMWLSSLERCRPLDSFMTFFIQATLRLVACL